MTRVTEGSGGSSWDVVPSVWREALTLAWESLRAGSPPVGAVVVDADGAMVARGRSRRHERAAPSGQIAGSRVAHAEINALAGLAVESVDGHVLYVTLEPCLLCASAAAIAHVDAVIFAGSDPMWRFLRKLPDLDPMLAARWYTLEGPLPGKVGALATLLPIIERLARDPTGDRVRAFDEATPGLVELAWALLADPGLDALREMTIDEAVPIVWPALGEGSGRPPG